MPHQTYVQIIGEKQGPFKAESARTTAGNESWIDVLEFTSNLETPRDVATGQPSGRRINSPIAFLKAWGAASPQLLSACATNENLTEVVFQFTGTDSAGAEHVFQTVTLTNASVAVVSRFMGGQAAKDTLSADDLGGDRVSLVFQKITVEDTDGQTQFSDDWSDSATT